MNTLNTYRRRPWLSPIILPGFCTVLTRDDTRAKLTVLRYFPLRAGEVNTELLV